MSMSRKLKKKLIAAAAALTVLGAGAANVEAAEEFTATVVFGSATTGDPTNPASYVGPGAHLTLADGMALIANQNTLVNLSALNFSGKYLAFGATSGTALVNQITGGPSTITGIIDKVSPPYDQGTVYLISPYAINIVGGGVVTGINVGQNTALITTMDQFNNFISGGVTPGPTPTPTPTPEEQAAAALRAAQESGRVVEALNLLDATRGNDSAAQAAQEALMNAQGDKEKQPTVNDSKLTGVQDHVYVVQTGAEQNNTGLDLSKLFSGGTPITVKEASSRVRNISKQYLKTLQDGDKAAAEQYKQQLKDANALVKALKEQEKNAASDEAAKALQGAQQGEQQPTTIEDYEKRFPGISELLNRPDWPQQQSEQPQQSGEAVVIGGSQESDALKRLNDIIGERLLTQEADARARLRKAQTSEERQQIMKELDEIHRQETEKVNEALKKAKLAELEQKYNDLDKEFWKLEKDSSQVSMDLLNAKERGASQEEIDRLQAKFDELSAEKGHILEERDAAEAKLEAARAQQAEQQNQGQQGEPYGHYQNKVEYKLGDNQDDGSYRVNVPQDQKQREQYEAILRGQGNGDAQTGTADSANLKQLVEDLRNYTEQQKTTPETTQENVYTQTSSSGVSNIKELLEDLHKFVEEQKAKNQRTNARSFDETVTTAGEQKEPEGVKWFDNIIGEKLLTQEQSVRNKLRNAKTSEERAAAMKELDEIHAEETKLVNEAMKQQEQAEQAAKQAAEQQARLEAQRRSDEQLKAIGGDALQSAIDHAARTRQAANGTAELLKSTKDLYEEADRACRQLSTQYWKEKEAGASPEKLEEINQKWQELNKIRNELKETVSQLWRNSNEAQQKADEAAALKERAQTLAEIGKIENQQALDEKAQLEISLAKALQEKAQADANLKAAKANADAADKALGDARKEKEGAQAAVDAWSDRYDREHGGAELQAKLDALDQRLESLQNQYADDSTTPEQADRINEEISRAYEEKESLEKAYLSEKEKAFENSAENRSLHEANERYDHALNDTGSVDKAEKAAKDADKMVTYFQRNIDEKQAAIDNATKTFEDRLDPESAIRRAESDLALAKMREEDAAENLAKAKEENKNKAQRAYDQAKDNTRQAMIAAGKASMLSKYDADAELSKLKAQQAKEQAANEQAARQGEQAKEQAANRAETSASGGVIHGGPTISEAR